MKKTVRVRFAPSPTGYLHIGNARTALFNWLFARHNKGSFILRIEDTDTERQVHQAEELIVQDLKWLGMDWDEGPDKGGPYSPYRQSDRSNIYSGYTRKLLNERKAYYCYCTPEELESSRQKMMALGQMPLYNSRCAHLSRQEQQAFENEGRRPSVRFCTSDSSIVVRDLIRGEVAFDRETIGDFIIVRSDGRPAYNFVVVIDDALMNITHVLRGEDHLSNSPRQILIYRALGFDPPQFGHMSMILGPDRSRLSKRHGATSIINYREKGYLPEALSNYLALLGWSSPDEEEIISREKLIRSFTVDRISKSAAVFDLTKLNWMNGVYLREADLSRITRLCLPYLKKSGYIDEKRLGEDDNSRLEEIVASVRRNMSYMAQISELAALFFEEEVIIEEESRSWLESSSASTVIQSLQEVLTHSSNERLVDSLGLIKSVQKRSEQKGKNLYMPIRIALTGKTGGPELTAVFSILGRDRCLQRIRQILQYLTIQGKEKEL